MRTQPSPHERASRDAAHKAAGFAGTAAITTTIAAAKGAGALAGYAGAASAVSAAGLGGASTALAAATGITAASGAPLAGAAATTALVSAVGGPVIAVGLVAGGLGLGAYACTRAICALFD